MGTDQITNVIEETKIPSNFKLFQNYPNPFNPETTIRFELHESGFVKLKVYDSLGNEIATLVNGYRNAGFYDVQFSISRFANSNSKQVDSQLSLGLYFYKLIIGNHTVSKKCYC